MTGAPGIAAARGEDKPDWAMSRREREQARRRREGLPPLRRRWPWVLLLMALAAAAAAGWAWQTGLLPGRAAPAAPAEPAAPAIDSRMQINAYEYATIAPQVLRRSIRVTGTLGPAQRSQLASQISGMVETVTARPGDRVEAGAVLVQIDVERLTLELNLQRSNAAATRAQLSLAENQLERVRALVDRGVATASELDSARSSVDALQASLNAQIDQVAGAELNLRNATLRAPFAGVVTERNVEPGQFVAAGTPLIGLVDLSRVEMVAYAPVSSGALIAPGQAVEVAVDGVPGRSFLGRVERINPVAAEGSRAIPVYVTLDNPDGVLLGGMFATGEIVVAEVADAIAVPAGALREDREGTHVLRIADGVLERAPVSVGETWQGGLVQVTAGLSAGDVVVTAALPELAPGDAVVLVGD